MNEPAANLLRFGQLRAWCALPERTLRDIAATGKLGGAELWPGGRRFYLKAVAAHVLFGAPVSPSPFAPEPIPELLRVRDILDWTGLTEDQFRWAEQHSIAGHLVLRPGAKRLYPKILIRRNFFERLLPAECENTIGRIGPTGHIANQT